MSTALAPRDAERLAELEATIARGLTTFVEVGAALAEIHEARLYRGDFGTFEEYCHVKWQMTDRNARRLMGASEAVRQIGPTGPVPANERQARPLTKLPPEQQREAWNKAVETAPKDEAGAPKITAEHVRNVVRESTGVITKKDGSIDKLATMRKQRETAASSVVVDEPDGHDVASDMQEQQREFKSSAATKTVAFITALPTVPKMSDEDVAEFVASADYHTGLQKQIATAQFFIHRIATAHTAHKEASRVSA